MLPLVETRRPLLLLSASLMLLLWVALAWYASQQIFAQEFKALVEAEQTQAKEISLDLADSFTRNLHFVGGIPDTFRQALEVRNAINKFGQIPARTVFPDNSARQQWFNDPVLTSLNKYLEQVQGSLGVDSVFIVNASGDCISDSNWAMPFTNVGVNYADRLWFREAKSGFHRMQYATGRTSHIAGLYFASPIINDGNFMGAVVAKVAIPSLAFLLRKVDAYVTDVNGVIIMAHDTERLMKAIPGASVGRIPEKDKLSIYQASNFETLDISPWDETLNVLLKKINHENAPRVQAFTELHEYGLTVFAEGNLATLPRLENARNIRFWILAAAGGMVIVIALASLLILQSMRKASKQVAESNDNLNLLLGSVSSGIWGQTSDGACTFINQAAATMLGFQVNEFIGKSVHLLTHHTHPDGTPYPRQECPIFNTGIDGIRRSAEDEVFWRKDGSPFPIRYSSHPIYQEGVLKGVVAIFDDITGLKQAEHKFNELMREQSLILETSLAGIGKVQNRVFTWLNYAFENMLGYDKGELIGKPTHVAYPSEQAYLDFGATAYPLLATGKIYRAQSQLRCKDGRLIWIDLSGAMLDAEANVSFWTLNDISEIKQAELTMKQALHSAELLAKSKAEFLANMSHEIRTPMNAIIGLSQLALNKDMPEEVREYLEKINSSSGSLLGILNDILDFSKMEAGKLGIEVKGFNLATLMGNLHNLFANRAQEKHLGFSLEIDPETPLQLAGDALRIQQILSNLVGNALKFTAEGQVTVRVQLLQRENSQARIRFSVSDSGIGLSEQDQTKLFAPFSQVDTSITRRFGGTGLGLSISHSLLKLMGSSFQIESELGLGSTFSFELLLGITSEDLQQNIGLIENRQRSGSLTEILQGKGNILKDKRVLVAEDNQINQMVVKEFLTLAGVIVEIANNGVEAIAMVLQNSYDAILMDVHMPEMGGVEATEKLRQQQYSLPIIALTAGVTQEERDNCKNCGMNDFVTKPVNPEELISVLCHWIDKIQVVDKNQEIDNKPLPAVAGPTVLPAENSRKPKPSISLPGFDLLNLSSMVGGDEKIIHELLCIFREDLAPTLNDIEAKITEGNLHAAGNLAHRIKGTAGNLGAKALQAIAAKMEATLKQGIWQPEVCIEFKRIVLETLEALNSLGKI